MNFLDVLNTRAGEIEKPKVFPVGTYCWKVNKAHKEGTAGQGAWNTVEIPIIPFASHEASNDVDQEELAAFGSLNSAANTIRFMFSTDPAKSGDVERTAYQLKKFLLDVLRVDGDDDSTIKELLARAVGCEFVAQAHHRVDGERDTTFVDVKNWMPME